MADEPRAVPAVIATRVATHAEKAYVRFSTAQRIEHIVLLVSFSLLGLTGLPQKYAGTSIGEGLIAAFGGIETIRIVHHISAIVFVVLSLYHFVVLAYKTFVLHTELSMLPGLKDVTDAVDAIRYNLGLTRRRPKLPRYSFDEKVEYWAMIWGTVIMALTGFMLWNPILFTRFMPGQIIPAAKAAHGGEALLAILAILIWHLYNVHLKTFNKSMFTGKMSEHHMSQEHAEELARIQAGDVRPRPARQEIQRRTRVFAPIAAAVTVLLIGFTYWLVTAEQTAITTVPTPSAPAFVPLPPTLAPTAAAAQIGKPIPHPMAGQENCDTCHGPNGVKPYPADHAGRPNTSCLVCHGTSAAAAGGALATPTAGAAMAISHPVQGREDCLMCHKEGGIRPVPPSHAGRGNDTCQMCHKVAAGISGTPAAAATPPAPASGPKPVPHDLAGKEQCDTCHGPAGLKPMPKDHEGRGNDTCTACHQPAGGSSATPANASTGATETPQPTSGSAVSGPKPVPHDLAGKEQCDTCHGPAGLKPMPKDHEGRSNATCTACHQPAGGTGAAGTPAAGSGSTTAAANPIPHPATLGDGKCDTCHALTAMRPYPQDHQGRTNDTCTACHKPPS